MQVNFQVFHKNEVYVTNEHDNVQENSQHSMSFMWMSLMI